jgi:hypothetical protein
VDVDKTAGTAVLKFVSHSAARKTFEGYSGWEEYSATWLSVEGEELGKIFPPTKKPALDTFTYTLFQPGDKLPFCLPVLTLQASLSEDLDSEQAEAYLGSALYHLIFNEESDLDLCP